MPTVTIFDQAWVNLDALFFGGKDESGHVDVKAAPVGIFAHELGHVISYNPDVQKRFDQLVRDKGIRPVTWYAASDPPNELFPEAFALYYSDPQWLKQNWPDLYNFFDVLDKTAPPAPARRGGRGRP